MLNRNAAITNQKTNSDKYSFLKSGYSYAETYSYIFRVFLDTERDSSSSRAVFDIEDSNINTLFSAISFYMQNCQIKSNKVNVGLPLLNTFGFNFTIDKLYYENNWINDEALVFGISKDSSELAHFVHKFNAVYCHKNVIFSLNNSNFINNEGIIFSSTKAHEQSSFYIYDNKITSQTSIKSSVFYFSEISFAYITKLFVNVYLSKYGIFYLKSVSYSSFSHITINEGIVSITGFLFGDALTSLKFYNLTFSKLEALDQSYITQQIYEYEFSAKQPLSTIMFRNAKPITIDYLNMSYINLANNGLFTIETTLNITYATIYNINALANFPNFLYITSFSSATIHHSNFYNINCSSCIGSIIISFRETLVQNSTFYNISSNKSLIFSREANFVIKNCTFRKNIGYSEESVLLSKGCTIIIGDSKFIENESLKEKFMTFVSTELYILECQFISNKAVSKTKGLFFSECQLIKISASTFNDSQPANENIAGVFYSIESNLFIENSRIINSKAKYGPAFIKGDNAYLEINNCYFADNYAEFDGGALYLFLNTIIRASIFERNFVGTASSKDGQACIYVLGVNTFSIYDSYFKNFTKKAIYVENVEVITISNSNFIGDLSKENRALHSISCSILKISRTNFTSLNTEGDGAGINIVLTENSNNSKIILNVENSNFIDNRANNGGALSLVLASTKILVAFVRETLFSKNFAKKDGGGFYYDSQNVLSSFNLTQVLITYNEAIQSGGGFRFMGMVVNYTKNSKIFGNKAYYGDNIACYPIRLGQKKNLKYSDYKWFFDYKTTSRLLLSSNITSISDFPEFTDSLIKYKPDIPNIPKTELYNKSMIPNLIDTLLSINSNNLYIDLPSSIPSELEGYFVSGQIQYPPLIFDLIDLYGQTVLTENTSTLSLSLYKSPSSYKFTSDSVFSAINGSYIIYPLNIHSEPGVSLQLNFSTTGIVNITNFNFSEYEANFSLQTNFIFGGNVRNCTRNEYLTDNNECWQCKAGFFNGDFKQQCVFCDGMTTMCLGGDRVGPKEGFWRLDGFSMTILACKVYSACKGTYIF